MVLHQERIPLKVQQSKITFREYLYPHRICQSNRLAKELIHRSFTIPITSTIKQQSLIQRRKVHHPLGTLKPNEVKVREVRNNSNLSH